MNILSLSFFSLIQLCVLLASSLAYELTAADRLDIVKFRSYIDQLKSNANLRSDPCQNFTEYACGNLSPQLLKHNQNILPTKIDDQNLLDFVDKLYLVDNTSTTGSVSFNQNEQESIEEGIEKKIRDFYLSCRRKANIEGENRNLKEVFQQIEPLNEIESWPVQRNFSGKEMAKFIGAISVIGSSVMQILHDGKGSLILYPIYIHNLPYSAEDVAQKMNQLNVNQTEGNFTSEQILYEAEKVMELAKKLAMLQLNYFRDEPYRTNEDLNESIAEVQKIIPDFDWAEYSKYSLKFINIDLDELSDLSLTIASLNLTRELVQLLNTYDSRTIMNLIVYQYTQLASHTCEHLQWFFRPAVLRKIWDINLSDADKIEQYEIYLERFERRLQKILDIEIVTDSSVNIVEQLINKKRYIIKNYKSILNIDLLKSYYNFSVDPEQYYGNVFRYAGNFIKSIVLPRLQDVVATRPHQKDDFFKILEGEYDHVINPNLYKKPFLYHFISDNYYLWNYYFQSNPIWKNLRYAEECLKLQNEFQPSHYENIDFMNSFISNKIAALDFFDYLMEVDAATNNGTVSGSNGNGSNSIPPNIKQKYANFMDILRQSEFTGDVLKKFYYLSYFQNVCYEMRPDQTNLQYKILKYSKLFNDVHQCAVGADMNQVHRRVCDSGECAVKHSRVSFLPYCKV